MIPRYSAFLAIGSASRAFYRFHRRPDARIFFAPYAVDNAFFARRAGELAPERHVLRAGFGIPPEACTFLFVGKLEQKKHPLDLLTALARLSPEERAHAHVLVAGDGELMSACK